MTQSQSNIPGQIRCPKCGQAYAVQPGQWPQYQGQTIACTRCGKPFTVAGRPPVVPPIPSAVTPAIDAATRSRAATVRQMGNAVPPPPKKTGMPGWAIALIIIIPTAFVVIVCICADKELAVAKSEQF